MEFPYDLVGVKRLTALLGITGLASLWASACVYDPDERCGPRQVLIDNDRCVCEAGFVPGEGGCVTCGENEQESGGECLCVEGYARPAEGAACEEIPDQLGLACDADSEPCAEGEYSLCHVTEGTSGYCTSACSSDDDCSGGYRCHEAGADSYCRRPPLGYLDDCKSDADCADGEATYCETLQENKCLVPCSAGNTDVCFEGEVCCNYVIFTPICVPQSACAPNGTEVQ